MIIIIIITYYLLFSNSITEKLKLFMLFVITAYSGGGILAFISIFIRGFFSSSQKQWHKIYFHR